MGQWVIGGVWLERCACVVVRHLTLRQIDQIGIERRGHRDCVAAPAKAGRAAIRGFDGKRRRVLLDPCYVVDVEVARLDDIDGRLNAVVAGILDDLAGTVDIAIGQAGEWLLGAGVLGRHIPDCLKTNESLVGDRPVQSPRGFIWAAG